MPGSMAPLSAASPNRRREASSLASETSCWDAEVMPPPPRPPPRLTASMADPTKIAKEKAAYAAMIDDQLRLGTDLAAQEHQRQLVKSRAEAAEAFRELEEQLRRSAYAAHVQLEQHRAAVEAEQQRPSIEQFTVFFIIQKT